MSVSLDHPCVVTARHGDGPDAALRLEAERWSRARHPGVAELVETTDTDGALSLTIREPGGPSLAAVSLRAREAAGVLAVIATTVADLHDIGITAGRLDPTAIKLGPDGRPVLCDLSRGTSLSGPSRGWTTSGEARTDVVELGKLAAQLAGRLAAGSATASTLSTLAACASQLDSQPPQHHQFHAIARRRADEPQTARAFADLLVALVPDACLPSANSETNAIVDDENDRRPRVAQNPTRFPWEGGLVTIVLLATAWWWFAPSSPHRPMAAGARHSAFPTDVRPPRHMDRSVQPGAVPVGIEAPIVFVGGVLRFGNRSYAVGEPGDVLAAGHWTCAPDRTVALLRPTSGDVFVFPSWPEAGAPVTARIIGHAPGATELARVPEGACDALSVRRPDGSTVVIRPWAPSWTSS